ncbi:GNAT family N-acetyltransferase [Haloglycomyces albus]|uniref:GNAT family N-acetyltransferase n=1 Tax=Haloglycomyces albus TaxID=526067 RepID=UPI00046CD6BA|nr:GNAT family N-acetyltransferase [Haloglycomyces albus]
MGIEIRRVGRDDFDDVLPLVADYQRFYKQQPDEQRNREFFGQLVNDDSAGLQLVARVDGTAVGFTTLYWVRSSTTATVNALMNDLYVAPEHRGGGAKGIGAQLMRAASAAAAERGYQTMAWETAPDNFSGQSLYDRFIKDEPGSGSREIWYHYGYTAPEAS